ncbi:MAG: AbrB/MazE/SpoVT family DNA-binding domain-containing protein [Stigonema ocellatum SAG 48.90 = DSM 106950]|nr:AbrB/MazE/SpoVT family DNA-binding domain-containing protein [Stigonema ocellatum SAG 48.90 = DSM 106950]
MDTDFVVKVTPEGQMELPSEIQAQLHPGDEYKISVTEDSIVLQKIQKPLDLNQWFQRIEELGSDPNQPTLEEINEMVKEVRRERRSKE